MPPKIGRKKEQVKDSLARVEGINPDISDGSELFLLNQE